MVHGWPLLFAALTACCSWGAADATTSSERPAASSLLSFEEDLVMLAFLVSERATYITGTSIDFEGGSGMTV